jgi:tRNA uridine 5-carboxymethylaminomethyl modification enzyme
MAAATDEAGIQFRILNGSKGPAVRATRAQADRVLYKAAIRHRLENQPNLWLFQGACDDLLLEGDHVVGAVTQVGIRFKARAVVLTAGTFLDGKIHVGLQSHSAGPRRRSARGRAVVRAEGTQAPARTAQDRHAAAHRRPQHRLQRMLTEQPGDLAPVPVFSFMGSASQHPQQVSCWITHTNARTHDIIRAGFDRSPMFTGLIDGVGPRTARASRTRSIASPTRIRTRSSSSPRG